jgi:hypothetical protein
MTSVHVEAARRPDTPSGNDRSSARLAVARTNGEGFGMKLGRLLVGNDGSCGPITLHVAVVVPLPLPELD